jgi:hypothetical protein
MVVLQETKDGGRNINHKQFNISMAKSSNNRRNFLKTSLPGVAGLVLAPGFAQEISANTATFSMPYIHKHLEPRIRFSAIGINHAHICQRAGVACAIY